MGKGGSALAVLAATGKGDIRDLATTITAPNVILAASVLDPATTSPNEILAATTTTGGVPDPVATTTATSEIRDWATAPPSRSDHGRGEGGYGRREGGYGVSTWSERGEPKPQSAKPKTDVGFGPGSKKRPSLSHRMTSSSREDYELPSAPPRTTEGHLLPPPTLKRKPAPIPVVETYDIYSPPQEEDDAVLDQTKPQDPMDAVAYQADRPYSPFQNRMKSSISSYTAPKPSASNNGDGMTLHEKHENVKQKFKKQQKMLFDANGAIERMKAEWVTIRSENDALLEKIYMFATYKERHSRILEEVEKQVKVGRDRELKLQAKVGTLQQEVAGLRGFKVKE
ncbi:hypothetical protein TrST_g6566 [Triparma strigata]|uniref:Uncharacterized protein n=1 Tax=Triparma strigata TaxID=1606541 RepID=A0A9W7EFS8_9STRA|nr:hypothetical protein TrST_g6566 [Triparma strigata]